MSLHYLVAAPTRLRLRRRLAPSHEGVALRAALEAAHLMGQAAGVFLRSLRGAREPLAQTLSQLKEAQLRESLAWEVAQILGARVDRIPERQRPHYSPAQRYRILEIKSFLGWSATATAGQFRVCAHTIGNWERAADPDTRTAGTLVRPMPPVRRLADVVRATVQAMVHRGFGGEDMVAQILARAGWLLSARSVRRIARRHQPSSPTPMLTARLRRPVIANFVHHVWMMDVTVVPTFLGDPLHVAGVFDAFSRVPLALQVFERHRVLPPWPACFAPPRARSRLLDTW